MASTKLILRGAIYGALFGCIMAVLAIGVGLVRALALTLSGGTVAGLTRDDVRLLAFYVGGFIVAGVVAGALGPLLPGRFGTYVRFATGGIVGMIAIAVAIDGSLEALDTAEWILVSTTGVVFGLAGAYGYLKNENRP
jgi:hypothetical protein